MAFRALEDAIETVKKRLGLVEKRASELETRASDLETATEALPEPLQDYGTTTTTITASAATWQNVPGSSDLSFGDLERPLLVVAHFGGECSASVGYSMVGVRASGALDLAPEEDVNGNTTRFGHTPFAEGTSNVHLEGHKYFILPTGVTTFRLQSRRNVGTGTQTMNYSYLSLIPVRWMD